MTLSQLRSFVAIARHRHFGRAAEALGLTQPVLSVQIHRLEQSIQTKLFERSPRGIWLTTAGELLLPHAERMLAQEEEALQNVEGIRAGLLGRVRVGVLPTIAAHFISKVLTRFLKNHPHVEVLLEERKVTEGLVEQLYQGGIELALGLKKGDLPGLSHLVLMTEDYPLIVSAKHRLARHRQVSVLELRSERFGVHKGLENATRQAVFQVCRAGGFEPKVYYESEQAATIQHLVAANLCVALLPRMVVADGLPAGLAALDVQEATVRRTVAAIWDGRRPLSTLAHTFIECAVQTCRRQRVRSGTAS